MCVSACKASIFFLFTHVTTVIVCGALNTAKMWVTYTHVVPEHILCRHKQRTETSVLCVSVVHLLLNIIMRRLTEGAKAIFHYFITFKSFAHILWVVMAARYPPQHCIFSKGEPNDAHQH